MIHSPNAMNIISNGDGNILHINIIMEINSHTHTHTNKTQMYMYPMKKSFCHWKCVQTTDERVRLPSYWVTERGRENLSKKRLLFFRSIAYHKGSNINIYTEHIYTRTQYGILARHQNNINRKWHVSRKLWMMCNSIEN